MKGLIKTIIAVLALTVIPGHAANALEIDYVGALDSGLFAPTSIAVTGDHLAVLEPFARRLAVFSADGQVEHNVDITGEAIGLARLSESRYLFCDRTRRSVVVVDLDLGTQSQFAGGSGTAKDPVDIIVTGAECFILDASGGAIVVLGHDGRIRERLPLGWSDGNPLGFPSSFAYDPDREIFHVFDQLTSRVLVLSRDGSFRSTYCSYGSGEGTVTRGGEITCDSEGDVLITDRFQGRIAVFSAAGGFRGNIELKTPEGNRLAIPSGIAVDSDGLTYVVSTEGHRVDMFFVEKSNRPEGTLTAVPAYPVGHDTVVVRGLNLIARVEGPRDSEEPARVDFRLMAGDDTSTPVTAIEGVTPLIDPDSHILEAVWHPDYGFSPNTPYGWQVRVVSGSRIGAWSDVHWFVAAPRPADFHLAQNYPNPFNPQTVIAFSLPVETGASIHIYNLLGQEVWQKEFERLPAGTHNATWDGTDINGRPVASGVYFYRLAAGPLTQTRKMVLLR